MLRTILTGILCLCLWNVQISHDRIRLSEAKGAEVMAIIGLLGGVTMGAKVAMQCPGAPSAWLFTAASVMYLFSELSANKTHKQENEAAAAETKARQAAGNESEQIVLLEGARQQYFNAKNTAGKKKKNAQIVKTMFMAAEVSAIAETIMEIPPIGFPGSLCAGARPSVPIDAAGKVVPKGSPNAVGERKMTRKEYNTMKETEWNQDRMAKGKNARGWRSDAALEEKQARKDAKGQPKQKYDSWKEKRLSRNLAKEQKRLQNMEASGKASEEAMAKQREKIVEKESKVESERDRLKTKKEARELKIAEKKNTPLSQSPNRNLASSEGGDENKGGQSRGKYSQKKIDHAANRVKEDLEKSGKIFREIREEERKENPDFKKLKKLNKKYVSAKTKLNKSLKKYEKVSPDGEWLGGRQEHKNKIVARSVEANKVKESKYNYEKAKAKLNDLVENGGSSKEIAKAKKSLLKKELQMNTRKAKYQKIADKANIGERRQAYLIGEDQSELLSENTSPKTLKQQHAVEKKRIEVEMARSDLMEKELEGSTREINIARKKLLSKEKALNKAEENFNKKMVNAGNEGVELYDSKSKEEFNSYAEKQQKLNKTNFQLAKNDDRLKKDLSKLSKAQQELERVKEKYPNNANKIANAQKKVDKIEIKVNERKVLHNELSGDPSSYGEAVSGTDLKARLTLAREDIKIDQASKVKEQAAIDLYKAQKSGSPSEVRRAEKKYRNATEDLNKKQQAYNKKAEKFGTDQLKIESKSELKERLSDHKEFVRGKLVLDNKRAKVESARDIQRDAETRLDDAIKGGNNREILRAKKDYANATKKLNQQKLNYNKEAEKYGRGYVAHDDVASKSNLNAEIRDNIGQAKQEYRLAQQQYRQDKKAIQKIEKSLVQKHKKISSAREQLAKAQGRLDQASAKLPEGKSFTDTREYKNLMKAQQKLNGLNNDYNDLSKELNTARVELADEGRNVITKYTMANAQLYNMSNESVDSELSRKNVNQIIRESGQHFRESRRNGATQGNIVQFESDTTWDNDEDMAVISMRESRDIGFQRAAPDLIAGANERSRDRSPSSSSTDVMWAGKQGATGNSSSMTAVSPIEGAQRMDSSFGPQPTNLATNGSAASLNFDAGRTVNTGNLGLSQESMMAESSGHVPSSSPTSENTPSSSTQVAGLEEPNNGRDSQAGESGPGRFGAGGGAGQSFTIPGTGGGSGISSFGDSASSLNPLPSIADTARANKGSFVNSSGVPISQRAIPQYHGSSASDGTAPAAQPVGSSSTDKTVKGASDAAGIMGFASQIGGKVGGALGSMGNMMGGAIGLATNPVGFLKGKATNVLKKEVSKRFMKNLFNTKTAIGRTVVFAPFAMKAMKVAKDAKKVEGRLDGSIANLDKQIMNLKGSTNIVGASGADGNAPVISHGSNQQMAKAGPAQARNNNLSMSRSLPRRSGALQNGRGVVYGPQQSPGATVYGPQPRPMCATGGFAEFRPDPNCSCRQSRSCKNMRIPPMNYPGVTLPGSFNQSVNSMRRYGASMYAGNTRGANLSGNEILSQSAAIQNLRDRMRAEMDKRLHNAGFPGVPYQRNLRKSEDFIASTGMASMLHSGVRKSSMFASLGLNKVPVGDLVPLMMKEIKSPLTPGANETASMVKDTFKNHRKRKSVERKIASVSAPEPADENNNDLFKGRSEKKLDQKRALANYEQNETDILDRPDVNLFKVISVRYLRSAKHLFKKSKL